MSLEDAKSPLSELPADRAQAAVLLVRGLSQADVARQIDRSEKTIARWLADPVFQAACASLRAQAEAEWRSMLLGSVGSLLAFLRSVVDDDEAPLAERTKTARDLLDRAGVVADAVKPTDAEPADPALVARALEWLRHEQGQGGNDAA